MYARDYALIATPIGNIAIEGDDNQLVAIRIGDRRAACPGTTAPVRAAVAQLSDYFSGNLKVFDLPITPASTPRGRQLRAGLIATGYGETQSYGELARRLDSGARAVGQLCARNPFPIIVPCHRILAAGGALGAYSAGDGPITKKWLLDHERRHR